MKLISKNENYYSPKADRGLFKNPFVKPVLSEIDTENQRLKINFSLQYVDSDVTKTLETVTLQFNALGQDTMITNEAGDSVEILSYLQAGGVYDTSKIAQWGNPSFERVKTYFDLESVWSDLEFKEQPLKQLAIDWLMNTLKIEGLPVKEKFELET